MTDVLAILSGAMVGLVLGLIGGGGSILAVPLLVYVVGVPSPHLAIGTSAVAVAASAFSSLLTHARAGNVNWPCALVFAVVGMVGAALGSGLGKRFDGQHLLVLFGLLMIIVALSMVVRKPPTPDNLVALDRSSARRLLPRLAGFGLGTGMLAGFFGIGGGFLIVPGLVAATEMSMLSAIGSSLVSVTAFGMTTAASYALSGLIDWALVALFVLGGIAGSVLGGWAAGRLARQKQMLSRVFACLVGVVGIYVVVRGLLGA